nr:unnamed protein product [Callosobruchus chinensis]
MESTCDNSDADPMFEPDEEIHNLVVTETNMPNSRQSRVYVRSQSANTLFCPSGIRSTQMSLCDSLVL